MFRGASFYMLLLQISCQQRKKHISGNVKLGENWEDEVQNFKAFGT